MRRLTLLLAAAALTTAVAACSSATTTVTTTTTPGGGALVGTFALTAGACGSGTPTGTYFRMIQPGGTVAKGKYFTNPDSTCPDKSFTVQRAGTDGGLVTGRFQPAPSKAFDAQGNALASAITDPGTFTAIKFGVSTAEVDPQTHLKVAQPQIIDSNGTLSGQITAWSAAWNNLYFNQGSPKPDGSRPGLTTPLTGTYDKASGHYVITWTSQIVGGPFNGFSGFWHLEGTFHPAA